MTEHFHRLVACCRPCKHLRDDLKGRNIRLVAPHRDLVTRRAVDHVEEHAGQALLRLCSQSMDAIAMTLQFGAVHEENR